MKIRLDIEYAGEKFYGWQRQTGLTTVQSTIEDAIHAVLGNRFYPTLFVAGRTDTGVHALNQVAHFEIPELIWNSDIAKLAKAINFYLHGKGVVIKKAERVANDFHARFSAKQREYMYVIYNNPVNSIFLENRAWFVQQKLDIDAMSAAANMLQGVHDFSAFRSSQCSSTRTVRTIDSVNVRKKGSFVIINIKSRAFLHNQVRIMVGTMKQIATGEKKLGIIEELFENKGRKQAGQTAPACGLYFVGCVF